MKTIEEKAKECIDNLIDSLSLEVNHEESNYDAGQVHALSNYGKEIYKVGFLEGQSNPKIKQLKWDDYDGVYFDSISAVGHYIVFDGDKFSEASYRFALSYNGNLVDYFESLDEAKAAAQADFEKRIKECLE